MSENITATAETLLGQIATADNYADRVDAETTALVWLVDVLASCDERSRRLSDTETSQVCAVLAAVPLDVATTAGLRLGRRNGTVPAALEEVWRAGRQSAQVRCLMAGVGYGAQKVNPAASMPFTL